MAHRRGKLCRPYRGSIGKLDCMRVAIIQSSFIPWRGYFDIIDDVDLFIIYDDIQFTRRDWRNRNRIKTPNGLKWLTVPVFNEYAMQNIDQIEINYSSRWILDHINILNENYRRAPFYRSYIDQYSEILNKKYAKLSELNLSSILWIMRELDIKTEIAIASDFQANGIKSERLIDILKKVGATIYLTGPSAKSYLDEVEFEKNNIQIQYKKYEYENYPQLNGVFNGAVSILDLLFNTGKNSSKFLKSKE